MIYMASTPNDLQIYASEERLAGHRQRTMSLRSFADSQGWNDAELARRCKRSAQQVHSWFAEPQSEGFRAIGEKLARSLEATLGLPPLFLDSHVLGVSEPNPQYTHAGSIEKGDTSGATTVPILDWGQVNTMLDSLICDTADELPTLDTFASASARAKFVAMPDDSMAPEFQPGDHILFDPSEAPHAGDVVLVQLPEGDFYVRRFTPRTAIHFDAVAINPNYLALSSQRDGTTVRAVMVEHRRYRKAPR